MVAGRFSKPSRMLWEADAARSAHSKINATQRQSQLGPSGMTFHLVSIRRVAEIVDNTLDARAHWLTAYGAAAGDSLTRHLHRRTATGA